MLDIYRPKTRHNVRQYILTHFNPEDYRKWEISPEGEQGEYAPHQFAQVADFILLTCAAEKENHPRFAAPVGLTFSAFQSWCQGLPSLLDTGYYVHPRAVDTLAEILNLTEQEKAKYTETDAENLLTKLIWRELTAMDTDAVL